MDRCQKCEDFGHEHCHLKKQEKHDLVDDRQVRTRSQPNLTLAGEPMIVLASVDSYPNQITVFVEVGKRCIRLSGDEMTILASTHSIDDSIAG